jgi:hypothetical protein
VKLGRQPLAGLSPERGRGAREKRSGPRALGEKEAGQKLKTEENPFYFSFQNFQSHFPKDFEIQFEFD